MLALNWPGQMSYDSVAQLAEARAGFYHSWHPPVMAWLMGLFDSLIAGTGLFVLFNGAMDRYFRAFDQADGKVLWETRLGSQAFAAPVTFSVDGRQYVAIAAGGGYNSVSPQVRPDLDQVAGGNTLYVFALPQQ